MWRALGIALPRLFFTHSGSESLAPLAIMAIISAASMIRSVSLFHLTLAVLLLKSPEKIAKQGVVLLLGQSMQLVCASLNA